MKDDLFYSVYRKQKNGEIIVEFKKQFSKSNQNHFFRYKTCKQLIKYDVKNLHLFDYLHIYEGLSEKAAKNEIS